MNEGDRGRDHFDAFAPDRVVETAAPPGMTGAAKLVDQQQDGVAIAIEAGFDHPLPATGGFALAPQGLARARPVTGKTARQRFIDGGAIHPGQHQHFMGVELLGDGRDQTLLIEGQLGQHFGKRQASADRGAFKSG